MSRMEIEVLCCDLRNWNKCKEAIRALSRIGPPAIPDLFRLLYEDEWRIRDRAVQALVGMRLAAVPDLCRLVSAGNFHARWDAIHALGLIGDARAVPALCRALQDDEIPIRYKAIEALEDIGDGSAVMALCEVMREEHSGLRRHAAEALGKIGRASAVSALCQALGDSDRFVRRNAADALRKLGQDKPLPRRILGERSQSPEERVSALRALSRVNYLEKGEALFFYLADIGIACRLAQMDSELDVREGAREVLECLEKKNTLLRASDRPVESNLQELLRPAASGSSPPETLLRPVENEQDTPSEDTSSTVWWQRWRK